jgi:prepilin-type N-terminal cleavage/methylation domain-containing protein
MGRLRAAAGFTLIELLVVVLIIGVLIAIAAPSFLGQKAKADDSAAKQYLTISYQNAKSEAASNDGAYPGDLLAKLRANEPQTTFTAGTSCADATQTGNQVIFDTIANSPTQLVVYAHSGSGKTFRLSAGNNSAPQIDTVCSSSGTTGGTSQPALAGASPTLSGGTPVEGTAIVGTDGDWAAGDQAPSSYSYQWQRSTGSTWVDIAALTHSYTPAPVDVGDVLRLCVTAHNSGGQATSCSSASGVVVPLPPRNSQLPAISGSPATGQTLTADKGTWLSAVAISYSYQWQRDSGSGYTDIAGATATTYQITSGDYAATLRVEVTAANYAGSLVKHSAALGPVLDQVPANTSPPVISGSTLVAATLTASAGAWTSTATLSYSYQWQRDSGAGYVDIASATSASYTSVPTDVNHGLRVQVTATNAAGAATSSSAVTAPISELTPVNDSAPALSGTAQEGQLLTLDRGTWTSSTAPTYSYQWQTDDGSGFTNVAGATGLSYTVRSADIDARVRARVTATNNGGAASVATPPTTPVVPAPATNTAPPTISGLVREGQTVTATNGSWTSSRPVTYSYRWLSCDAQGLNCGLISGETNQSYVVRVSDIDQTLEVQVTAANSGGQTTAVSAPSAPATTAAPQNTALPAVTPASPHEGQTLTTTNGSWSSSGAVSYSYQWQANDGSGWSDVPSLSSTYLVRAQDVDSSFRVRVTATNAGGSTQALSSATAPATALAPANSTPPSISGTPAESQTLTGAKGTWTSATTVSYTYQWQRCDSAGAGCADISGATTLTYTVAVADVGQTIRFQATATNTTAAVTATSDATAVVAPTVPAIVTAPVVSGTAQEGTVLAVSNGIWAHTPTSYSYQWQRSTTVGGVWDDVAGATSSSYTAQAQDVGFSLRAQVTASNLAGSAPGTSNAVGPVTAQPPANTVLPAVSGTPQVGATLTTTAGSWTSSQTTSYDYQWQHSANGTTWANVAAGGTNSLYTVAATDLGDTLRVQVTAANVGGSTTVTSSGTGTVLPAAPVNTALPLVSGTPQVGATLTATNGSWANSPTTYGYQWQRSANGTTWSPATGPGATTNSYTINAADLDDALRVSVTATNAGGSATALSAATSSALPAAPGNTALPTTSGAAQEGALLTAQEGSWTNNPTAYADQWQTDSGAGWADVAGATALTYTIRAADIDARVRIRVMATNAGGQTSATSSPTAIVVAAPPTNTTPPTISGQVREGQTVTASNGTWTSSRTVTYSYQWLSCDGLGLACTAISGETSAAYLVRAADIDQTLEVQVTAANVGGQAAASSAPSTVASAQAPQNTVLPDVTPTNPHEGQTLAATNGTWTSSRAITYSYQWQYSNGAGFSDLTGATSSTYALQPADVGLSFRIRVTATNTGGATQALSGAAATVTALAPASSTPPSISGTAQEAQTLTGDKGTWTSAIAVSYAYQWRNCDSSGAACANISGATSLTYVVDAAYIGQTIRFQVTATNTTGATAATSTATSVVIMLAPAISTAPVLSGTAQESSTLNVSTGVWAHTPASYAYQWQRSTIVGGVWDDVAGATTSSYVAQSLDVGFSLRVQVTAQNSTGAATATSNAVGPVVALPPQNTVSPVVSGTYQDSQTLTAAVGSWSSSQPITSYDYQWLRCAAASSSCVVVGTNSLTYILQTADVGSRVLVGVDAVNSAGTSAMAYSANQDPTQGTQPAVVVAVAPPSGGTVAIAGTAQQAQTLTATTSGWSGAPASYSFTWQRRSAYDVAVLRDRPLAYLRLDESSGTSAANLGSVATTGTYNSPLTLGATGALTGDANTAVNFTNGDIWLPVGPAPGLLPTSAITVEAWVKTTASGVGTNNPVFSRGTFCLSVCSYELFTDSSGLPVFTINAANGATARATGATVVNDGLFHYLAGSYDGTTTSIYVDGKLDGTSTAASGAIVYSGNDNVRLGSATALAGDIGFTYHLIGTMDEAGMYDKALTCSTQTIGQACSSASQIGAHYAAGTTSPSYVTLATTTAVASTSDNYTVQSSDIGSPIRVGVTAQNSGGASATVYSAATAMPLAASAPSSPSGQVISGQATQSSLLLVNPGSWTSAEVPTYSYQWRRCDAAGASCVNIAGATSISYSPTSSDVTTPASTLRAVVTATNSAGSGAATTAATAAVTPPWVQVVNGANHSCALLTTGHVLCWGANASGQLGDFTNTPRNYAGDPSTIGSVCNTNLACATVPSRQLSGVASLVAGADFTCALMTTSHVQCWGANTNGQLGDFTNTARNYAGGPTTVGSVCNTNIACTTVTSRQLTGVTSLVAGANHACALFATGHVVCWGLGTTGQLGDTLSASRNYAGSPTATGAVCNAATACNVVTSRQLSGVTSLVAGTDFSCALFATGHVVCWGIGTSGQLGDTLSASRNYAGDPAATGAVCNTNLACNVVLSRQLSGVSSLVAGANHVCALFSSTGHVICWGLGTSGQLGDTLSATRNYAGDPNATGAVCNASTVCNVVTSRQLSGVTALAAGTDFTCALFATSHVQCWGLGTSGQLGDFTNTTRNYAGGPTTIGSVCKTNSACTTVTGNQLTGVYTLSAGASSVCALMTVGNVQCWGLGTGNQLGDALTTPASRNYAGSTGYVCNASSTCNTVTSRQLLLY